MPAIAQEAYSKEQFDAAKALISGPRGGLRGPFISMIRSPEFMNRAQHLGEYIRFDSVIPQRYREFAILNIARHWQQTYEWHAHVPIAISKGVREEWIEELGTTGNLKNLPNDFNVVYQFCKQINLSKCITDEIYSQTLDLFDEQGVVELCGLCGYYTMLAMLLNVSQTHPPSGSRQPFHMPRIGN
ncbi:carboxymuconolactone decarboxylase family protein [Alteromonas sp. NFXS44]|uniref:carboxymuconolactone decarboxylase family protein n=1 Tax=Alteromonas sp. NFXS44 TaxID=2818435 RepID=UPI0032DF45EE